jgi:uncharacterized HhH-GPD family protein
MLLDQQVPMEWAFTGPYTISRRLGGDDLDAHEIAAYDPEAFAALLSDKPAVHRYPGSMAKKVHDLAVHVRDRYDGDAARVWTDASDSDDLLANIKGLPGFGEMKIKALSGVLAKRFGVAIADDLVPWHPTLGDVDSPQALEEYQAAKKVHKKEWSKAKPAAKA